MDGFRQLTPFSSSLVFLELCYLLTNTATLQKQGVFLIGSQFINTVYHQCFCLLATIALVVVYDWQLVIFLSLPTPLTLSSSRPSLPLNLGSSSRFSSFDYCCLLASCLCFNEYCHSSERSWGCIWLNHNTVCTVTGFSLFSQASRPYQPVYIYFGIQSVCIIGIFQIVTVKSQSYGCYCSGLPYCWFICDVRQAP